VSHSWFSSSHQYPDAYWLDTAEHIDQYCQPFIAFNLSNKDVTNSKTGYGLAISKSAKSTFEEDFGKLKKHLATTFDTTAICSY